MKKVLLSVLILICLLIVSCGGDIKISLFTRDLMDVMAAKENAIYTNVNVIIESLTDPNDIDFLRNNLNGFSNEHAVEYNYSTSLSFDIKVPIIKEGTRIDMSKDLLVITGKEINGQTLYYISYNKDLISRIDRYIYKAHYQNIDLKSFKIKIEINNDERRSLTLTTYSAYVNGKAYPFDHEEILKERDRISLEISEIFNRYISGMEGNSYPVFSIK